MLAALDILRGDFVGPAAFEVEVIDVDADPALEAKYGESVPVLEAEGRVLCHYFLDESGVREYLTRRQVRSADSSSGD